MSRERTNPDQVGRKRGFGGAGYYPCEAWRARRRNPWRLLSVGAFVLFGCASLGTHHTDGSGKPSSAADWLTSKAFFVRQDSGDALLSLTRSQFGGAKLLSQVVSRAPGAWIEWERGERPILRLEAADGGKGDCTVSIYLNGGRTASRRGHERLSIDDVLPLRAVDALELYGRETGPLADPRDCASLLVWSFRLRNEIDEPFHGSVTGHALAEDTGQPMPGVVITLQPDGRRVVTDTTGVFAFEGLVPKAYTLLAALQDTVTWKRSIYVHAGDMIEIEILMSTGLPGRH